MQLPPIDNINKLNKRIHKTSTYFKNGTEKKSHYTISIPYTPAQNGLGDGLTNIMIEYSTGIMFGIPETSTPNGHVPDSRPQTIIANHCNHHNTLPFVKEPNTSCECYEGTIFRRNINLQRLARKQAFLQSCKLIQDDLFISLLVSGKQTHTDHDEINLMGCLPIELIELIVKQIQFIGLFNTYGIEYTTRGEDFCC